MRLLAAALATGLLTGAAAAQVTPDNARSFQRKLAAIIQNGEAPASAERRTTVSEAEVNAYLRFGAADRLPVGVTEPSVGIESRGRLNGRAIVDLDLIRQQRGTGGWLDPVSYLTGRVPITASGVLETNAGRGRFTLETAEVAGVPIPKPVLQEIVSFYTRTPATPHGIDIDAPFELPAAIQRIDVERGQATIVQ